MRSQAAKRRANGAAARSRANGAAAARRRANGAAATSRANGGAAGSRSNSAAPKRSAAAGGSGGSRPGTQRSQAGGRGGGQRPARRPAGDGRPPPGRRPPPPGGPGPRKRRWYRRPVAALLLLPILLLGLAGAVLFVYFFTQVPLPDDIGERATRVLDVHGEELGTLEAEAAREDISLQELPDHVPGAVLAAEDSQFYEHPGVSIASVFRAAFTNVVAGEISQGGSTISQQYVKNITADSDQTILRKVREAAMAVKLERQYSKDEILEYYLNSIYFGRGAFGVQAAAQAYFGVDAAELDPGQAAQIAAIIPAPTAWDPADNPEVAGRRYRHTVDRMVATGRLEPRIAGRLLAEPPATEAKRVRRFSDAPFFMAYVERELANRVDGEHLYRGLTVHTTLDPRVQQVAQQSYDEAFNGITPTAAIVVVDNETGGIAGMIGGKDYVEDQVNMALARRQPGSTFKLFALAAWIGQGKSPDSWFDAPATMSFTTGGTNDPWKVNNYGLAGYGELSLREATWRSVNTVYAQVAEEVGWQAVADAAQTAGITSELPANPSTVLGTAEVAPLELTEAFATFARAGVHRDSFAVTAVERGEETLYEAPENEDRAFSEQVANTVTDVLTGVISSGTGRAADIGRPAAGKTGTTQNHADAWFSGYTRQYSATVWMGNRDDNQAMDGSHAGGGLPAEVWGRFMRTIHEGLPVQPFPEPTGELRVTRASPEPEEPECPDGYVLGESQTGEGLACLPEPEETEAPTPDDGEGDPQRAGQPAPSPSPSPSPRSRPLLGGSDPDEQEPPGQNDVPGEGGAGDGDAGQGGTDQGDAGGQGSQGVEAEPTP